MSSQLSVSPVAIRQMTRFLRLIADCFPTEDVLARRREAEGADAEEELCRRGCGQPAALNSECFACLREEWPS